jgi:hypothetical protein
MNLPRDESGLGKHNPGGTRVSFGCAEDKKNHQLVLKPIQKGLHCVERAGSRPRQDAEHDEESRQASIAIDRFPKD